MVQNVFLLTLASLAMRAVSMLFQVYLSGQVGAAGLGLMQLIMTVHAFAMTVGTSGIRVAAMYLSAEEYGHRRPSGIRCAISWCVFAGLLLSSLVGLAMGLCADSLAAFWVKDLRAAPALRLLGMTLPLNCLSSILCGYFTACGKIRKLTAVEIADRIASVALTAWLLSRGSRGDLAYACSAIIGGGALATLGSVIVLTVFLLRDLRPYPPDPEPMQMGRRLLRFCVPVALNDYLRSGLGTLEQFLIPYGLARCGGSRTQALADYGTIHGMVFPVLMFLSTVLYSVCDLLVPRLARYKASGSKEAMGKVIARCFQSAALFSAVVAGAIFLLAKPLGLLLYDSPSAGRFLRIFAPLLPILYLDCIIDGMHKGLGEQIYCVRVNTLTNLMDVLGLYFLLPRFGIGGYFFTYALTHVVNFYLSLRRLIIVTDLRLDGRYLFRVAVIVCACCAFILHFASPAAMWPHVLLCAGMYLSLFFFLFVMTNKIDA